MTDMLATVNADPEARHRGTRAEKFHASKGWSPSDETAEDPNDVILRKKK